MLDGKDVRYTYSFSGTYAQRRTRRQTARNRPSQNTSSSSRCRFVILNNPTIIRIIRAVPDAMAAATKLAGSRGDSYSILAPKPKIAPVPLWTQKAHPKAVVATITVSFFFSLRRLSREDWK